MKSKDAWLGLTLVALLAGFGYRLHAQRRAPPGAPKAPDATAAAPCEHTIARADCPFCTPALLETRGWCAGHGVPEALCTRCHRDLIPAFRAKGDWCAEHALPETQCARCDPRLAVTGPAAAAPVAGPTTPTARRTSPPRPGCRTHAERIQLASPEVVAQVGIATAKVLQAPFRDLVEVVAQVAYPADRRAELSARLGGLVVEVRAALGQWVTQGEVLAVVDAPELGAAKAELVSAGALLDVRARNHAREVELAERGVGTQRAVLEADTRLAEARAELQRAALRLRALGLSAEEVQGVRRADDADSRLAVRAPFAGVVVTRDAVQGEVVQAGEGLLTIVDTRTMWALLDVPEASLARVGPGQPVVLTVHALPGEQFGGRVTWVSTALDPRTRTLAARAELRNDDGRLRANAFGRAQVALSDRRDALMVPVEAVQWEGCCNVVFVPDGADAFRPRKVRLGGATATHVEVLLGLEPDDVVVTVGAFLLRTELLKGSIGAGCCEGEE